MYTCEMHTWACLAWRRQLTAGQTCKYHSTLHFLLPRASDSPFKVSQVTQHPCGAGPHHSHTPPGWSVGTHGHRHDSLREAPAGTAAASSISATTVQAYLLQIACSCSCPAGRGLLSWLEARCGWRPHAPCSPVGLQRDRQLQRHARRDRPSRSSARQQPKLCRTASRGQRSQRR